MAHVHASSLSLQFCLSLPRGRFSISLNLYLTYTLSRVSTADLPLSSFRGGRTCKMQWFFQRAVMPKKDFDAALKTLCSERLLAATAADEYSVRGDERAMRHWEAVAAMFLPIIEAYWAVAVQALTVLPACGGLRYLGLIRQRELAAGRWCSGCGPTSRRS